MAICAVIDLASGELVNTIVAEVTDLAPDNCRLVEIPTGYYWLNGQVVPVDGVLNGN